jgi:gliding motility-associated-like protein
MKKVITVCILALYLLCPSLKAQQYNIDPIFYTIFDADSLRGFDETAARQSVIDEGSYGPEVKIKMYNLHREYINNKYDLVMRKPFVSNNDDYFNSHRPSPVPGCTNEDFESSTPALISSTNQIAGWTITGGYNGYISPTNTSSLITYYPGGLSNATSCNLIGCCPMPPTHSELIDCSAPGGYLDNQIGPQYPVYSVFGSGNPNAAAAALNPQLNGPMFGTKVVRINDGNISDYSMEKLSKTFLVSASNALFQFAFLSVFQTGHTCCDAGAFQIRLSSAASATGPYTVITCPNFSVSAPSSQCTQTVPVDYYIANPTASAGLTYSLQPSVSVIYNKWKVNSIDLTPYINQYIGIDILSSDCDQGGHYGKVYFDAQCGPMTIYGNGTPFAADIQNVIVPTCGAAGATICAAAGLGPYSWAGLNLDPGYTVPSMTNQCITSSISTTYTLYMQPQGACNPISRVVTSTITPAPLLLATAVQATCGNTLAVVQVTPSGSAANPSTLIWTPTPLSLNTTTTVGQYQIPTGANPILVSVTASDPLGCKVTATANVYPAAPYPTFTIANLTGSYSITCLNPSINLDAQTTYSYNNGTLNYFWSSNSATFATSNVNIVNAGTYTVSAIDPVTNCSVIHTVQISQNTIPPTASISPTLQVINCNLTSITNITATASQSVNVTHNILAPTGGTFSANSYSTVYTPGAIGTYTYCITSDINGCSTCSGFSVTSSQGFPTYSVVSPSNFTLGCTTKSVATINITMGSTTPPGGPVSYTLIGPTTSTFVPSGTLSPQSTYTTNVPGNYTVITKDNISLCETRTPISILSNTFAPPVAAVVPRQILDCYVPKIKLIAQSTNTFVDFTWSFPGVPGNQPGDTITIFADPAKPTNSLIANYTITVTDKSSTCKSTSVVPMFQNLYVPKAVVTNGGVNALTCKTPSVMFTNQSSTSIPPATGFSTIQPVIGLLWEGPSPQVEANNSSTYEGRTVGLYTMTVRDLNNGCTNTITSFIDDARDYPIVNQPTIPPPAVLDCGAKVAAVTPIITTATANLSYSWTVPPGVAVGAGGTSGTTLFAGDIGEFGLRVINTINGCYTDVSMNVINGSLTAEFDADHSEGFAPLNVILTNKSHSSIDNNGITTLWSFGNGNTFTHIPKDLTKPTIDQVPVVYTHPGLYTVTLFASKGSCSVTAQKQITVEIASKVEIPNIFTPNNDGVNDVYFIRADNLTEMTLIVFDRWGHLVYELTSHTGNIKWDGKSQRGAECAEGVYFYTFKATGKDGVTYDKNGTITLSR